MAEPGDPQKSLSTTVAAILLVGGISLLAGLTAELFEVRFLKGLGSARLPSFLEFFLSSSLITPNAGR